jgi:plastocyanin
MEMRVGRKPEMLVAAAAAVLFVGAAYGASQGGGSSGSGMARGTEVEIRDFVFGPAELSADVGATVTWTNRDEAAHTVRGDAMVPAMSGELAQGDSYTFTFDAPGTYEYVCTIHPSMTGTIVIGGPA